MEQKQLHSDGRASRGKSASTFAMTLKMNFKVIEYNIHNGDIRWQISTIVKVTWRIFVTAVTVAELLMFQICNLENRDQGHGVQHSQRSYSMAIINLYTFILEHFRQFSLFSRYSHFKIRDFENIGEGHEVQHLQWRHSMAKSDFISDINSNICSTSHRLCDIRMSRKMPKLSLKIKVKIKA